MSTVNVVLRTLTSQVVAVLPPIDEMSKEDLAAIFLTYGALIGNNFIPWMSSAWTRCHSDIAREACRTNLYDEVNEDHPKMLRDFVAPLDVYWSNANVAARVHAAIKEAECNPEGIVQQLGRLTASHDGLAGVWVMAALETTSVAFIDWMDVAADRLGLTDKLYLKKHGEADVLHASQFSIAVESEAAARGLLLEQSTPEYYPPLMAVLALLKHIFQTK